MSAPEFLRTLNHFIALTNSLFSLLASPSSSTSLPPSTVALYTQLATTHARLAVLLEQIELHQAQNKLIQGLVGELRTVEQGWRGCVEGLQGGLKELGPILESAKEDRTAILNSQRPTSPHLPTTTSSTPSSSHPLPSPNSKEPMTTKTLLSFARHLAPFTSAPPKSLFVPAERELDYTTGRGLPEGANPPFPLEDMLRRGRLLFDSADQEGMGTRDPVTGAGVEGGEGGQEGEEERIKGKIEFERQRQGVIAQQRREREEEEDEFGAFDLDLNPDF